MTDTMITTDDDEKFTADDLTLYDVWDHLDGLGWFALRGFDNRDRGEVERISDMINTLAARLLELCGEQRAAQPVEHVFTLQGNLWEDEHYTIWADDVFSLHADEAGAIAALDRWLDSLGIDVGAAHYGASRTDTSLCNDPDPDTLGGHIVTWGINRTQVQR